MAKRISNSNSTNILDKHLPKFDKLIVRELKELMAVPESDEELKEQSEMILGMALSDSVWKKLYKLFYRHLQRAVTDKFDVIKELLKYRVSKQPKQHEAIHFYLHPDILGAYDSESWIRQPREETSPDTSEIPSE